MPIGSFEETKSLNMLIGSFRGTKSLSHHLPLPLNPPLSGDNKVGCLRGASAPLSKTFPLPLIKGKGD